MVCILYTVSNVHFLLVGEICYNLPMKITKLGHCCLLIEKENTRILTDPGFLSNTQNELRELDYVLITHEHQDHLHTDSLVQIIKNNPKAKVITNSAVSKILTGLDIAHEVVEGEAEANFPDLHLSAHDGKHAEIFEGFGQVQNTGYFIDKTLYYPGDAYTEIFKEVPVLALPVAGPWCKVSDSINFALKTKPRIAFPVHDGLLNENGLNITHRVVGAKLSEAGIDFKALKNNDYLEAGE